ncbi:MAG TPA: EamA family transporter RarD [Thermoanaerobaculia bacterium]|nr:EamA family transporter RarD [Thermoanaerobaculia bacterium]
MSEPLPLPDAPPSAAEEVRKGALYAIAAYLWWGFSVFYFKAVAGVPPLEIMAHRVVWSVPLLFAWLAWRGRLADVRRAVSDRRTLAILLVTTALIAGNWLVFIIAVNSGRVTQASLGYYINPLVNVLLGVVFLGERLRGMQIAGVLLATAGVAFLTVSYGELPVISLFLAGTFALYGLLRKTVRADGMTGLAVETSLLLPLALGFLLVQEARGGLAFVHGTWQETLLLPLGGLVTTLPLVWFANAVRRLRLATIGFIQYLSPSLQLLLATAVFGEPFTRVHLVTFACIWLALALYSLDAWRRR